MNYLPSNLEFKDGVAFIGETSLLDVAKSMALPSTSMTGNISEIILTTLLMHLEKRHTLDMQQKHLSVKP